MSSRSATPTADRCRREIAELTRYAREHLKVRLGIHTHDDIGLGVANALAALDAGATHVQGTLNGYGERTGNCNLTSVMPILRVQVPPAVGAAGVAGAAEGAVAVPRRDGEPPAQSAAALGGRGGLLAQGRHARQRGAEGDPQLRAHRSRARRQHAPRPHQRSRWPQQHRDEGARARLRRHQQHAGAARHARPHQGPRAPGLRVRGGRWIAGAADPPGPDDAGPSVRRRRLSRVAAARGRDVGVRGHRQGARRQGVWRTRSPKATAR